MQHFPSRRRLPSYAQRLKCASKVAARLRLPSHAQRLKVASTGQVYESKWILSKSEVPRWEKFVEGVSRAVSVRTAFRRPHKLKVRGCGVPATRVSSSSSQMCAVHWSQGAETHRHRLASPFGVGPPESQVGFSLSLDVDRLPHAAIAPDITEVLSGLRAGDDE